jgi:hypothetical protein
MIFPFTLNYKKWVLTSIILILFISCKKFVEVGFPRTSLSSSAVFASDATATAAISGIYNQMSGTQSLATGFNSLSYVAGLSADELVNYQTGNLTYQQFFENSLTPSNSTLTSNIWGEPYQYIYKANAILEGLQSSSGITPALKSQLRGEALFIRAFAHFYLVNLFGDVPLVLTTDYRQNAIVQRVPKVRVYQQIKTDLKEAQNLLSMDYSFSQNERVRPNQWAATALLGRVYLYQQQWDSAELQTSRVINNTGIYSLTSLDSVFLANSSEAIWQLASPFGNTTDAQTFIFSGNPPDAALRNTFVNEFETGDLRKQNWIGTSLSGTDTFYYPYKYKATVPSPITEYSMVLRLAEQYLIRAEARAMQGKITGGNSAETDVNFIRNRAGLPNTIAATLVEMIAAISNEMRFEFFTEWGHRWLNLKRLGIIDTVLQNLKPAWSTYDQLYPIPKAQLDNDPGMANAQNPGY